MADAGTITVELSQGTAPRAGAPAAAQVPAPAVKRWFELYWQPNHPEVIAFRRRQLAAARRRPCPDRTAYLVDLARGKRVLDVGVVDHLATAWKNPDWLHGKIAAVASYALGIDVLQTGTRVLQEAGFNVRLCDFTKQVPDVDPVDLVVCGEVIEHLGHPQALFDSAARILRPGGRLALTTPNPYYLGRALRHLLGRDRENVDHVALLFPSGIAELASRAGLLLDSYRGALSRPKSVKERLLATTYRIASAPLRRETACGTMIYECVKPAGDAMNRQTSPTASD